METSKLLWINPLPGGRHSGNIRAHGSDDPLPKHDEAHGDAKATIQGDEHRGFHLVLVDYAILKNKWGKLLSMHKRDKIKNFVARSSNDATSKLLQRKAKVFI
jgi:hypothetical protein